MGTYQVRTGFRTSLWLNVSLLLLIILALGVTCYRQLDLIGADLTDVINIHHPKSDAAQELEINVNGIGFAVLGYLHDRDAMHLKRISKDKADITRELSRFSRLEVTPEEEAKLAVLRQSLDRYFTLAGVLTDVRFHQEQSMHRLLSTLKEIDELIDDKIDPAIRPDGKNAYAKLAAANELEININGIAEAVGAYLRTHNADYVRKLHTDEADFQRFMRDYELLTPAGPEHEWASQLRALYLAVYQLSGALIQMENTEQEKLNAFVQIRRDLDNQFDEGLQKLAQEEMAEASQRTESRLATAHMTILSMLILGLGIGLIGGGIFTRRITHRVETLSRAAGAIAGGDLDQRVSETGADVLGQLAHTFNVMAESRQQIESDLVRQAGELAGIVEHMVDGLISINESGIVQSFNSAAERIFGYQAGEVIGNNIKMLMPQPYHNQHDGYVKHYLETGETKIIGSIRTVEGRRKDGSTFPMDLAVNEMRIGATRTFIGVVRNVTERIRDEREIADKNRELALRSRYEHSYAKTMALFSSTYDRDKALSGLLSILADHHPYPVSAIYTYNEWSGGLELAVSHGAPSSLKREIGHGEGLIGQAAMEGKVLMLEDVDAEGRLAIEAGILEFRPVAVVTTPISFQDRLLGVMVLAASKPLIDLDKSFIEQLGVQLGVAMNNINQYGDLKALSDQLKVRGEEISQKNIELENANRMKS